MAHRYRISFDVLDRDNLLSVHDMKAMIEAAISGARTEVSEMPHEKKRAVRVISSRFGWHDHNGEGCSGCYDASNDGTSAEGIDAHFLAARE